jgi:hypothetical protein
VRETIAVSFRIVGNSKVERRKPDCPEVAFREVGNCVGAGRRPRASHGRLVSYVAGARLGRRSRYTPHESS